MVLLRQYKRPVTIISTIIGVFAILFSILDLLHVVNCYDNPPYLQLFCGTFLILLPLFATYAVIKRFRSNPLFSGHLSYTFGESGYKLEGETFKSEFSWTNVIYLSETGKFLILHHSKISGHFVDKTKLTPEQMFFLRSKVRSFR